MRMRNSDWDKIHTGGNLTVTAGHPSAIYNSGHPSAIYNSGHPSAIYNSGHPSAIIQLTR